MRTIKEIKDKRKQGLIDYMWELRSQLLKAETNNKKKLCAYIKIIVSPFTYLAKNKEKINYDKSLFAVCQICTDFNHVTDINLKDNRLSYLAQLFNRLFNMSRELHMCYDCGTVARGVFFQLVKAYRGHFTIHDEEIERIKKDYYMNRYKGAEGVKVLRNNIHRIKQNCLFLCATQMGPDYGHIYIIEKIYINQKPRFRIYQSCLNAFLLVDYIEYMDYCHDLSTGINIDEHLDALQKLFSTPSWDTNDIKLFVKWFNFYPISGHTDKDVKLFTCTYLIF